MDSATAGSEKSKMIRVSSCSWLAVVLMSLAVVSCGGGGEDGPTVAALTIAEVEVASFELLRAARSENGIANELGFNRALGEVARAHSEAMRDQGFLAHTDPSGEGLRARLRAAGLSFASATENLVQVSHRSDPAALAHAELMASPEHRKQIVDSTFQLAGVGVARSADTYWFTQIFIEP